MKHISALVFAAALFFRFSLVFAQFGLHSQFLSQGISAQQYQPALLLFQDFERVAVEAEGAYWLGANTFSLDGIFSEGNYISEESKDRIISQLTDNNRLQLGSGLGIHANLRAGGLPWNLAYRQVQTYFFEAGHPNSAGLLLYGNARYAGDTISDEQIAVRQQRYDEFAVGTGFQLGQVRVGIRGKSLMGKRLYAIDELSYSLYTAPDGAQIGVKSQYDLFDAKGSGPQGWGLAADNDDRLRIQASLTNIGFVSWEGKRLNRNVDFVYEGFEARNFIGANASGRDIAIADTIQRLLFPDTLDGRFRSPVSAIGSVGIRYGLTERDHVIFSAHQTFGRFAPSAKLPLIHVAYHRDLGKILTLGANIYSGGYDIFGAGMLAQVRYRLGEAFGIQAFYTCDNALGLIVPGIGQGISMSGGLGLWY